MCHQKPSKNYFIPSRCIKIKPESIFEVRNIIKYKVLVVFGHHLLEQTLVILCNAIREDMKSNVLNTGMI